MSDLLSVIRGRPADLLPFEEVREHLRLRHFVDRGLREVPLEQIVGSLGRAHEFTRAFLPRDESLRDRWTEVSRLAEGQAGYPPVELYKVGDAYFVVDGHHRVSVARFMEAPTIEARVREFLTPVAIEPDDSIEDIVLDRGLADFLEATGLRPAVPDEFRVTVADGYTRLVDHISVHRWFRGVDTGREASWAEAATSWLETLYRPMIEIIRKSGVLDEFPGRTEADLYLFTMAHLHTLRQRYGPEQVSAEGAVEDLRETVPEPPGLIDRLRSWWKRPGDRDDHS